MDPAIINLTYMGIQAAKAWLEFSEAARSMTKEDALAHFEETQKKVAEANALWEAAGE